jgi:hypothetical protein
MEPTSGIVFFCSFRQELRSVSNNVPLCIILKAASGIRRSTMSMFDVCCVCYTVAAGIPFADTMSNVWGMEKSVTAARSLVVVALTLLLCFVSQSTVPAAVMSRIFAAGFFLSAARVRSVQADFIKYPLHVSAVYVIVDLFFNTWN